MVEKRKRGRPIGSTTIKKQMTSGEKAARWDYMIHASKERIRQRENGELPRPEPYPKIWYSREHSDTEMRIWSGGWLSDQFKIIPNHEYEILRAWYSRLNGADIRFLDIHDMHEPGDNKA